MAIAHRFGLWQMVQCRVHRDFIQFHLSKFNSVEDYSRVNPDSEQDLLNKTAVMSLVGICASAQLLLLVWFECTLSIS